MKTVRYVVKSALGIGGPLLQVGAMAPDFDSVDATGKQIRLSDYRGKRVVLWFFPKADTPG